MKWIKIKKSCSQWHKWFAWYPVTVEKLPCGKEKRVWLEYVERKGEFIDFIEYEGGCWIYKYREIKRGIIQSVIKKEEGNKNDSVL